MIHKLSGGTGFQVALNNLYLQIDQRQLCITSEYSLFLWLKV